MKRTKFRAAVHNRLAVSTRQPAVKAGESYTPALIEIEQDDGGYYLFYLDVEGQYLAHTWHENLEDAKRHAQLELAIQSTEWIAVSR